MTDKDDDSSSLGDSSDNNLNISQKGESEDDSSLGNPSDNNLDISQKSFIGSQNEKKGSNSSED